MQVKFGLRFILLVLLTVVIGVPLLKVAVNKINMPESVRDYVMSV